MHENLIFCASPPPPCSRKVWRNNSSATWPSALVEPNECPAQDFEHDFQVVDALGSINHRKCTSAERCRHFAAIVPPSQTTLDHHGWWRRIQASEQLKEPNPGIVGHGVTTTIEGDCKIDHCEMDGNALDESRRFLAAAGGVRGDTHWFKQSWEPLDPRVRTPTCTRKEQVEPGGSKFRRFSVLAIPARVRIGRLETRNSHIVTMANGMPDSYREANRLCWTRNGVGRGEMPAPWSQSRTWMPIRQVWFGSEIEASLAVAWWQRSPLVHSVLIMEGRVWNQ